MDYVIQGLKKDLFISDNDVLENNPDQQLGDLLSPMPKCLTISAWTKRALPGEGGLSEIMLR